jgi:ParE toxin of type II toxin-antitoxin system, parDE
VSNEVIVTPIAEAQLHELLELDREVVRAALELMRALRENPWLGDEMRARPRYESLSDCRRVGFDRSDHKGKPRYRLVYRNEPSDGAPHILAVLSVGERENMRAYGLAVKSRAERLRALRETLDRSRPQR